MKTITPPSAVGAEPSDRERASSLSESRGFRRRTAALVSSSSAAVLGVLPHVLHHVGPLAGAALLAGVGGTLVFGAVGLLAAVPILLRLHRRTGGWRAPAGLLLVMMVAFSISSFVIGPAISGGDSANDGASPTPAAPSQGGHDGHHR